MYKDGREIGKDGTWEVNIFFFLFWVVGNWDMVIQWVFFEVLLVVFNVNCVKKKMLNIIWKYEKFNRERDRY